MSRSTFLEILQGKPASPGRSGPSEVSQGMAGCLQELRSEGIVDRRFFVKWDLKGRLWLRISWEELFRVTINSSIVILWWTDLKWLVVHLCSTVKAYCHLMLTPNMQTLEICLYSDQHLVGQTKDVGLAFLKERDSSKLLCDFVWFCLWNQIDEKPGPNLNPSGRFGFRCWSVQHIGNIVANLYEGKDKHGPRSTVGQEGFQESKKATKQPSHLFLCSHNSWAQNHLHKYIGRTEWPPCAIVGVADRWQSVLSAKIDTESQKISNGPVVDTTCSR